LHVQESRAPGEINNELYTKFIEKYKLQKQAIEKQIELHSIDLSNVDISYYKDVK
jgi:hypothetical protein